VTPLIEIEPNVRKLTPLLAMQQGISALKSEQDKHKPLSSSLMTSKYLQKKVNDYWQQDKIAGRADACPLNTDARGRQIRQRPADFITVDDILLLIKESEGTCHLCHKQLMADNWVVDRIDSKLMHVRGNVALSCTH